MTADDRTVVLHYTGYTVDRGGLMVAVRNLCATRRFRAVLGVSAGFQREGTPLAIEAVELPEIDPEMIDARNFLRARRVADAVRAWLGADAGRIFHVHSRAGLLVALWLWAWGERRLVASVHCYGRHRWFYRAVQRVLGPRLRWLSPAMKRYYYGGATADWSACVPVALATGEKTVAIRRFPGGRPLRLGAAGQLTPNKRWDLVLAALARLPRDASVEFHHIGATVATAASQRCAEDLRARARRDGTAGRVHWHGWQPDSADLLARVDVVVVPFEHESFSLIAVEALCAGVPVIALRGGGPDDYVIDGVNGWLLPPRDAEALAQKLKLLLSPDAWNGLRPVPGALDRFAPERVAEDWVRIYGSL